VNSVTVVGASLAGLRACEAIRAEGFDGSVVLFGAEPELPYDRTALSKDFLTGKADEKSIALCTADDLAGLDIDVRLAQPVASVTMSTRELTLGSGRTHHCDALVVATGARARELQVAGAPALGMHTVRTMHDAKALRAELAAGPCRVLVVGSGFLGSEIASSCTAMGLPTTVVEAAPFPLAGRFPAVVGERVRALHEQNGVDLRCGRVVRRYYGGDRVAAAELSDGSVLEVDVVVTAIGSVAATDWLHGSGLEIDDGVLCDEYGLTGIDGVVVTGDAARVRSISADGSARFEHWHFAQNHPALAVQALLHGRREGALDPPYMWSDQHGHRIQMAGVWSTATDAVVTHEPATAGVLITQRSRGRLIAVIAVDEARQFTRRRRELRASARVGADAGIDLGVE
jgi:NADPH-dependent 2,4-dienoyl-CoA reductase/sulfur reductase-like enzyme